MTQNLSGWPSSSPTCRFLLDGGTVHAYSYPHGDDHGEEIGVPMRTLRARVVPARATSGEPASWRGCRGREAAYLPQVQVGVLGNRKASRPVKGRGRMIILRAYKTTHLFRRFTGNSRTSPSGAERSSPRRTGSIRLARGAPAAERSGRPCLSQKECTTARTQFVVL